MTLSYNKLCHVWKIFLLLQHNIMSFTNILYSNYSFKCSDKIMANWNF